MDKNAVTGSSDLLTVCIANDLAVKIHGRKQRTNTIKKFGGNNNFIGKYGIEYKVSILLTSDLTIV
jgi:hypothetical protein